MRSGLTSGNATAAAAASATNMSAQEMALVLAQGMPMQAWAKRTASVWCPQAPSSFVSEATTEEVSVGLSLGKRREQLGSKPAKRSASKPWSEPSSLASTRRAYAKRMLVMPCGWVSSCKGFSLARRPIATKKSWLWKQHMRAKAHKVIDNSFALKSWIRTRAASPMLRTTSCFGCTPEEANAQDKFAKLTGFSSVMSIFCTKASAMRFSKRTHPCCPRDVV
mmetsp:Transcript_103339/g.331347  ORF Transcript_103339/g.331347 Transcript_103339/m.331347 type:complete len:222 (-) Transcript_103339:654-1319(-)